jgi:SnoaL-like domain
MNEDEKAIIDLTVAYTWALDTKSFDELRSVFAPNATAMLLGVQSDGLEAIMARIKGPINRLDATQHIVSNHQVRIKGNTATCRCHLQAQHVLKDTPGGDNFLIGGVYEDTLERRNEGWRIVHRTLTPIWEDGNPAVIGR